MKYELTHDTIEGALVVRAKGKFDRQAGSAVEVMLAKHDGLRVLSLAAVDYISSSGIAAPPIGIGAPAMSAASGSTAASNFT